MKKNINRAGVYISQPGGYRSFSPKPLPPEPPIETDNLQLLLSAADVALGRLDGVIHTLPSVDMFVAMYVRKEAVLSSQIEGTQSSLQDVLSAEAKIQDPKRPPDSGDVLNYIAAMDHGLARLQTLPLSTRLIREIHAKLMQNTRGGNLTPGELRKTQNWIGPAGCALQDATFVPPPAQEIAQYLAALEKFSHGDSSLPLLLKIGLLHAQFETIHPFLDGNGRLGRLLITFLLCEKKILSKPVLYLSHYFKQHRQQYYDKLQLVRDHGDWESWLTFFLRGVVEVSRQATDMARQILALREKDRQTINQNLRGTAGNGHRVLDYLYQRPIISVKDAEELTGVTYQVANNLIARINDCGILQEFTDYARNRRFIHREYVRLFE